MIISFDLDDTLIPSTKKFDVEKRNIFQMIFGIETLRKRTVDLIKNLKLKDHKIYIYTTSFRKPSKIWWTFFSYGIKVDKIINQKRHLKIIPKNLFASKYPPAFNIDIHIDDSYGVGIEGNDKNFRTIIVNNDNTNWCSYVLQSIEKHSKI